MEFNAEGVELNVEGGEMKCEWGWWNSARKKGDGIQYGKGCEIQCVGGWNSMWKG